MIKRQMVSPSRSGGLVYSMEPRPTVLLHRNRVKDAPRWTGINKPPRDVCYEVRINYRCTHHGGDGAAKNPRGFPILLYFLIFGKRRN